MRVLSRPGPLLLALGLAVVGCNEAGKPPAKQAAGPPAQSSPANPEKPAAPGTSSTPAAAMHYVLTVEGMS